MNAKASFYTFFRVSRINVPAVLTVRFNAIGVQATTKRSAEPQGHLKPRSGYLSFNVVIKFPAVFDSYPTPLYKSVNRSVNVRASG